MQVIRDNPGKQVLQSAVVTIGNFDGLHLGHQALLNQCRLLADGKRPIAVLTFEPLPQSWFRPETAPARLVSVRQRLEILAAEDIDLVWLMRFNQSLASMTADEFVQSALVHSLSATDVVIGDDFHYGRARQGDTASLIEAGKTYNFGVTTVPTVELDGTRVSSTRIRQCLDHGDFVQAECLLGRPYRTQGRVIQGRQLGRKFGYPTANMRLAVSHSPLQGIFAVRARYRDGDKGYSDWHDGVANLGTRPAVGGEGFLVEVHLFDFERDLYGRRMEVEYVAKLRDEVHFEDIDDLVKQMREDERLAKQKLRLNK